MILMTMMIMTKARHKNMKIIMMRMMTKIMKMMMMMMARALALLSMTRNESLNNISIPHVVSMSYYSKF